MEQKLMQLGDFRKLYDAHMGDHFPPDELKPFYIMERAIKEGKYFPYGYYEDGELKAYTCLIKKGDFFLLDYFAVMEQGRGKGTGSRILDILKGHLTDRESVLLEVEEPLAEDERELDLQKRRIQFYLRNGARYTELKARVFGVPYRILSFGRERMREKAQEAMEVLYHSILNDEMYRRNVCFALDKQN